ncbi:Ataxin-2 [Orchesella cincta]|uniref:Ataxin-2 n=1 Tax=Orchesella cincta TaxID=48709 RepID=A0A1D2NII5_ORCCI|nr:Ataxin-2 [Orchesella cincta]
MTILVGSSAEVRTRDGEVYEGIYVAFSSAMEILLEAAHLVTDNKDDDSIEKHFDVLVIPSEKVISMKCVNADLTYPTREFATDTAISSGRGGGMGSKELTPWECSEDTPEELTLDAGSTPGNTVGNGWEAKDMFKKNEEKYGVVSTFNHDLSGYTTKVDKNDTEFKRLEEQANQIAREIEGGTASWDRTQVENGDEEEAFSAVVRPRNNASSTSVNNNNNNNTSSKWQIYTSFAKSKQLGAKCTSAFAVPSSIKQNGPAHTNNNSSMNRKTIYNQNQNPRNNYGAPPNAVYHQDRRNFDSRRAPPPNQQYGNAPNHEVRRPEDSGPRPRMPNKVPSERKDPAKLKEFGNAFRFQSSDTSQMRRPPGNPPPPQVGMRHMLWLQTLLRQLEIQVLQLQLCRSLPIK